MFLRTIEIQKSARRAVLSVVPVCPRKRCICKLPRWTPENRPVVDRSEPASGAGTPSANLLLRSLVKAQGPCGPRASTAAGVEAAARHRGPTHAGAGSLCRRVRQLRGPQVRTCAWWSRRSSIAVTAAVSPRSLPQSSTGRFEVSSVDGAFVAPHHDLEQILGRGVRELAHAEVVDDEQRHGGDVGEVLLAGAGELRLGELLEERRAPRDRGRDGLAGSRRSRWPGPGGSCPCRAGRGTRHRRAG